MAGEMYMKRLHNRIPALIIALLLLLSVISVNAETVYIINGYSFTLIDSARASIVGWDNSSDTLSVPNKIGDYYIAEIAESAFSEATYIKSLDLSNTKRMYTIGKFAFANSALSGNLTIPSKVTCVGVAAFENCKNIESLDFSSDGGAVPAQCFRGCSSLASVTLSSFIENIGDYSFANCTSLSEIVIPSSVKSISATAFDGCGDFTIYCYRDSYAMQYAKDNGISYKPLNPLPGDVNLDGVININDVTYIQMHDVQLITLGELEKKAADVNRDGEITIRDATLIQMYLANIITEF